MERYTTTITFQSLYIQCDKSKGSTRWWYTKGSRNWTIHLSVIYSTEINWIFKTNNILHKKKENFFFEFRQYRHKIITEISSDKKYIAYRGVQTFFFDKEASAPLTESDDLTVLNVQLNVSNFYHHHHHYFLNFYFIQLLSTEWTVLKQHFKNGYKNTCSSISFYRV